jgi:hypothetical protein
LGECHGYRSRRLTEKKTRKGIVSTHSHHSIFEGLLLESHQFSNKSLRDLRIDPKRVIHQAAASFEDRLGLIE